MPRMIRVATALPRVFGVSILLMGMSGVTPDLQAQSPSGDALGKVDFPVSCDESIADDFNHAVALLHHMTYPQARDAFEEITRQDPTCAMAHWGLAMTLFQPSWPTRPGPEELQRGWDGVQRALSAGPGTRRELLFVTSAEAFFRSPGAGDYWERIRRWERATGRLYEAFPEDPDAATLYALAHLATAPADRVSLEHGARSAEVLLSVLDRYPDHPGAMHYLIHANDAPGREDQRLDITRRYEEIAPDNPHALHMPTHIYTRLGDWDGVARGNIRAAEAALLHPAGESGELVSDEFPHAIEYLVYAYLQQGRDSQAASEMDRLQSAEPLQPGFKTAFHIASIQARYSLERRDWSAASELEPRTPAFLQWDRFAWPEAVTWLARGLGAAHLGELDRAREASLRLAELETAAQATGEELFARNIRVLRLEVDAWTAHAELDGQLSEALLREAADVEASTPKHAVTPGPTLPAMELLGDLLLEQQRAEEALVAYQRSLEQYPRRFNSLVGAARAAREAGDERLARAMYRELLEVAAEGERVELEEARAFVEDQ